MWPAFCPSRKKGPAARESMSYQYSRAASLISSVAAAARGCPAAFGEQLAMDSKVQQPATGTSAGVCGVFLSFELQPTIA